MAITLSNLPAVALSLVMAAAIFVAAFLVTDGLDDDLAANSFAANATDKIDEGMYNLTEYIPTVGTILGVSLILGVVIAGFYFGRNQGWM